MAETYKRTPFRFFLRGTDLVHPINLIPEGFYYIATNIRSYQDGIIQSRPGLTSIHTLTGTPGIGLHSIKRLNDPISSIFDRLEGMGTLLFADSVQISTGFSGNPLTFAIANPPRTPRPYCYIGDSTKIQKHKAGDSSTLNWGISPPNRPPTVQFGEPAYKVIANMEAATDWTAGGTAAAPTDEDRINTTIASFAYDLGLSSGWASIEPTDTLQINEGVLVLINGSEALIDMVLPAIPNTSVAGIIYDSGSTGWASIQLTATIGKNHIRKGSLISISGESLAVYDVIFGDDGIPSIRVFTAGTVSGAVTGKPCFRAYVGSISAGNTIISDMVESDITTGIGTLASTVSVDASQASNRPIDMQEDEMHISILVDDLSKLIEAKIYLDVDSATNDFTRNYYFKALSPNDFVAVTKNTSTVIEARLERLRKKLQKAIQNGEFERAESLRKRIQNKEAELSELDKTPIESQTTLGDNQWTELKFKLRELSRVGSDSSRTLKNIAKIQVLFNVSGTVEVDIDSWWIGGTFGPDIGNLGEGYQYIYRYRNKETGVTSAWSPPSRTPIEPHRQRVTIGTENSADSQTDTIDVARRGGVLPLYKIIGSTSDGGSFNDDLYDDKIKNNQNVDLNSFQPFAITDLPKIGTVTVAGTTASITAGDNVDVNYVRNTIVYINNKFCTLSGPPLSTTKFETNQNLGSATGVSYYIPQPLLTAQPLPSVFGPIGYGETGIFIFAVGSTKNPSTLFWTNGNDPDLMHDYNNLDVCSPSEQLISGCLYNGEGFLFSSERMFRIFPNFSSDRAAFVVKEIPNSKGMLGLLQKTALCTGPRIWYRGKDGIYETAGGEPKNITDTQLYPLFPHDGQAGVLTNGYFPPDDTKAQFLEYCDGLLYYDFIDTNGSSITWVYNTITQAWVNDKYHSSLIPIMHYAEEGDDIHSMLVGGKTLAGVGTLYQYLGTSDSGQSITCDLYTHAFDAGEIDTQKNFPYTFFDADPNNATLNIQTAFNELITIESIQNRTGNGRAKAPNLVINSGDGRIAFNESLIINWASTTAIPKLYAWAASYRVLVPDTPVLITPPDDAGYNGAKFLQGVRIKADTSGNDKTAIVQYDAGTSGVFIDGPTITLNHNGESIIPHSFNPFSFTPTLIGHLFRLKFPSTDTDNIRLFEPVEWIYEPCPELVDYYITQQTTFDLQGYIHLGWLQITLLSNNQVNLVINIDGVDQSSIAISSTSGSRIKTFIRVPAKKGKTFIFKFFSNTTEPTESQPFRLYQRDIEVAVKQWGSNSAYDIKQPFGDVHRVKGAII